MLCYGAHIVCSGNQGVLLLRSTSCGFGAGFLVDYMERILFYVFYVLRVFPVHKKIGKYIKYINLYPVRFMYCLCIGKSVYVFFEHKI